MRTILHYHVSKPGSPLRPVYAYDHWWIVLAWVICQRFDRWYWQLYERLEDKIA